MCKYVDIVNHAYIHAIIGTKLLTMYKPCLLAHKCTPAGQKGAESPYRTLQWV